jgi:two-component sensor histidine kinase
MTFLRVNAGLQHPYPESSPPRCKSTDRQVASTLTGLISAGAAVNPALALHALSTNAVKYGALSNATGKVHIRWTIHGDDAEARFELLWQERGGPPVVPPRRRGFGSRIIEASLSGGMDGASSISFAPQGVEWRATAALRSVQAES